MYSQVSIGPPYTRELLASVRVKVTGRDSDEKHSVQLPVLVPGASGSKRNQSQRSP